LGAMCPFENRIEFNKNYGKWFVSDVLHAIQKYALIESGERVCVALSGGRDSTTLLGILYYLKEFSHLSFDLSAVHIKTEAYDTMVLAQFCDSLGIEYFEETLRPTSSGKPVNTCYMCSRLKRGALSSLIERQGIQNVAYGHHAGDVAETFFMNIVLHRKLGSFSPRVEYSDNSMVIIRPLVYLDQPRIHAIHKQMGLPRLEYRCKLADRNIRATFRQALGAMDNIFQTRDFSSRLVESLENIDYTNIWGDLIDERDSLSPKDTETTWPSKYR